MLAATTTTTTTISEVKRIVGDPLPSWVLVAAGAALLVVILAASLVVSRRIDRSEPSVLGDHADRT